MTTRTPTATRRQGRERRDGRRHRQAAEDAAAEALPRSTAPISPSPRTDAGMAFDRARGVMVPFGGISPFLNDTWLWDGAMWTQAQPPSSPSPRSRASLAFHPGRGTVMLFGGIGPGTIPLADTWEWNGTTWTLLGNGAVGGYRPKLAFDAARGVMACYLSEAGSLIEWSSTGWGNPISAPLGRFAYDPDVGALVVFGTSQRLAFVGGQWVSSPQTTAGHLLTDSGNGRLLSMLGLGWDTEVHFSSAVAARAVAYGAGCGPQRPATLGCNCRPFLGSTPRIDVACGTGGAATWLVFGLQLAATPLGAGCTAHVDTLVHVTGATAGNDRIARFAFAVPPTAALLDVTLFAQAVVAEPLGLGFSNGMRFRLGW